MRRLAGVGASPRSRVGPAAAAMVASTLLVAACGGRAAEVRTGGGDLELEPAVVQGRPIGTPEVEVQASGTDVLLQAVSPVSDQVVWVSGHQGRYARTTDGGATWSPGFVPGADTLQFRDVHALSAETAWLMSAGPADMSRIYRTDDGGENWTLQWTNEEPDGFYDCIDFWDENVGVVYGDAIAGELRILRTVDGGENWELVKGDGLPRGQLGEGGFAASGTCFVTGPDGIGWISTGNAARSRVLVTTDYGASWSAFDVPIPARSGAGLFSISFRDSLHGVAFGGDLGENPEPAPRVAVSSDGGRSWETAGEPGIGGAIFGGAWIPGTNPPAMVIVAPTGAEYSADGGQTWLPLDSNSYWGLGFASPDAGWLVGPGGRIARVSF